MNEHAIRLFKGIKDAYKEYQLDENIEKFQNIVEGNISALEGINTTIYNKLMNYVSELEYVRFMFEKEEQKKEISKIFLNLCKVFDNI